jgi:hypothetical protein
MAAVGSTPIKLYGTNTASQTPLAANLANDSGGIELAVNGLDGKLFYKDNSGNVQVLASKATGSIGGSTTQVQFNNSGVLGGSASLTWSGTVLTSSGFAGPLNGTVGATTPAAGAFTTVSASGVATFSAGTVSLPAITTTGDTNTGIFFPAADTIAFTEGGTESMRIDSSGNVGIGTSSPSALLDIVGVNGTEQFRIGNTTGGTDFGITVSENLSAIINSAEGATGRGIQFQSGGTNTVIIDSSGNVGIGTSSPAAPLHVFANSGDMLRLDRNNTGAVGNQIAFRHSNAGTLTETASINAVSTANADTGTLAFYTKPTGGISTERMRIDSSGNVGIGTSSPASPLDLKGKQLYRSGSDARTASIYNNGDGTFRLGSEGANGVTEIIFNKYGGTEAMRIDSSGNLLVGTTSSAGTLATNVQPVVAGIFRSATATVNVNNNTAGTLFTLPDRTSNISTYIVSATINSASASAANYSAYAIICVQNTTAKIMTQVNGALMTITLSGLNVQVTQSSGGNQDCVGTVTRVA